MKAGGGAAHVTSHLSALERAMGRITGRPAKGGNAVAISAVTGEGMPGLLAAIDARIAAGMEQLDYAIPPEDGARLAWLYQHGEVLQRDDAEDAIHLRVRLLPADRARFEHPRFEHR